MSLRLILPNEAYKESFWAMRDELLSGQDPFLDFEAFKTLDKDTFMNHFTDSYLTPILQKSKGIGLPDGHVPSTLLWFVDEKEVLGRVCIRSQLNDFLRTIAGHIGYLIRPSARGKGYAKEILRQALDYAWENHGIEEALVTCDARNEASYRTIVAVMQERGGRADTPTMLADCEFFPKSPYHPVNRHNLELRFWLRTQKERS